MNHRPPNKTLVDYGYCSNLACKDLLRRALAAAVGQDGVYTYESLADALDIEERTLRAYALGECLPGLPIFFRLCGLLGDSFTAQFTPLLQTPQQTADDAVFDLMALRTKRGGL